MFSDNPGLCPLDACSTFSCCDSQKCFQNPTNSTASLTPGHTGACLATQELCTCLCPNVPRVSLQCFKVTYYLPEASCLPTPPFSTLQTRRIHHLLLGILGFLGKFGGGSNSLLLRYANLVSKKEDYMERLKKKKKLSPSQLVFQGIFVI